MQYIAATLTVPLAVLVVSLLRRLFDKVRIASYLRFYHQRPVHFEWRHDGNGWWLGPTKDDAGRSLYRVTYRDVFGNDWRVDFAVGLARVVVVSTPILVVKSDTDRAATFAWVSPRDQIVSPDGGSAGEPLLIEP